MSPLTDTHPSMPEDCAPLSRLPASGQVPKPSGCNVDFSELYEAQFGFVWRMVKGLGVLPSSIDDAVQEIFMTAHRRLPEFRGDSSLRTWLCSIAYRVALNYRRAQKRKGGHEPLTLDPPSREADPAQTLELRRQWLLVKRFLDELDPSKRVVFLLTFVEQMSAPEVAAALEIPINTVYSRLHSARTAFRHFAVRQLQGERS